MGEKVYSDEFKRGAVDLVFVQRHTITSAGKRLGVNYHTIRRIVIDAEAASQTCTVSRSLPAFMASTRLFRVTEHEHVVGS